MMVRNWRGRPAGERLWRLRKMHDQIDAVLRDHGHEGVEIEFFYNGERLYGRRWAARQPGVSDAAGKRAELERGGWSSHW
jgi:hypothetical protein